LAAGGFTETWQGELLKAEAITEGGTIVSSVDTDLQNNSCGGENCGMIATLEPATSVGQSVSRLPAP
jgi:hypothetical protein